MTTDARITYTKAMIRNSFIKLLNEKPLAQIKLKEVCELAGINRSTFYRYYQDIYDWYNKMETECLEWAQKFMQNMDKDNLQNILIYMLTATSNNFELFNALFNNQNNKKFSENVFKIFLEKASINLDQWDSYFIIYGWDGIIKCWIDNGLKQSPQEIASYMISQLNKTLSPDTPQSIWKC